MKKLKFISLFVLVNLIYLNSAYCSFAWTQMTDFGGGVRDAAFGFSIGNYGYAGTGRNPSDKDDFWRYDPSGNTWTQMANYSGTGRYGLVGFSIGNYGYAGTGWVGIGGGGLQYRDFWQYDPNTNSWIRKADFGGTARYSAVGFSIGNKGYVGLGFGPMKNDFWEYDPIGDSWTQRSDFPYAREGAVCFSLGNKGYVGTGYDSNGLNHSDIFEFDPSTNLWSRKSDIPGLSRRAPVAFTIGNYAYVGMGYNDTTYLTDFYQFDPIANQWTTVASIGGIPRYWSFSFSINNYGYVGVGSYGGVSIPIRTSDFWRFEDCDGSPLGISVFPVHNSNIYILAKQVFKNSLDLEYDLEGERNAIFNLYNNLGQLIISVKLPPNSSFINVPVSMNAGIYYFSVDNHDRIIGSGKVTVN
jgi:N-acetylneuraminic acid mutarotase